MKKVIKLTESDLVKIIRKTIKLSESLTYDAADNRICIDKSNPCNCFEDNLNSKFCNRVKTLLEKKENKVLRETTKNIFNHVLTSEKYFPRNVMSLGGIEQNEEYTKRMNELKKIIIILDKYNSCEMLKNTLYEKFYNYIGDEKHNKMHVDNDYSQRDVKQTYSTYNRINTNYKAQSYIFTHLLGEDWLGDIHEDYLNMSDDEFYEKFSDFINHIDSNIDAFGNFMKKFLYSGLDELKYLKKHLDYTRHRGNENEKIVFDSLKNKYGNNNVIEFSGDFGFVDFYGIDGILILDNKIHPIQISSADKPYFLDKKEFKDCEPIFYKVNPKTKNITMSKKI